MQNDTPTTGPTIKQIVGWTVTALLVLAVVVIFGGDINNWASGR